MILGIYLTVSMAVASVAVILTVLVMKLHHCSPKQKRVPKWVRIVVLGILAKIVRCNCVTGVRSIKREYQIRKQKLYLKQHEQQHAARCKLLRDNETKEVRISNETLSDNEVSEDSPFHGYSYSTDVRKSVGSAHNSSTGHESNSVLYNTVSEILKYLKYLVIKSDDNDAEDDIISEWKQVALVVDRLLFWSFLLITMVSTLVILVLVPVAAHSEIKGW